MAHGHTQTLLVPTKLIVPQGRATWICRERLLSRFTPDPGIRLISVVAPAGFGKSTLVAQALGVHVRPGTATPSGYGSVAWLSLDEHDQDPLRFLAYLTGAITHIAPAALQHTQHLLANGAPLGAVIQALLAELSALPHGLRLVLDDYHTIDVPEVHRTVAHLLRQLPPNCQLVLISRVEPPLPLARLRVEGQLVELGATDLRFTSDETAALLASLTGRVPSLTQVTALNQQTEGWALAIQLAVLAGHTTPSGELSLAAARRQITEYLADEVFERQTPELQQALLVLAIPERFCPGLVAALLDHPDDLLRAESLLDQLVRANLFVIPLDPQGRWYRFHHLFRDLLLRRMGLSTAPATVRNWQRRAANWLIQAHDTESAVQLLLAAGDEDAAAAVIEERLRDEFRRDVSSLPPNYWLNLLPPTLINRRPCLALLVARLTIFNMDMGDLARRLDQIDALLTEPGAGSLIAGWPNFEADLTALRGILAYWEGRPQQAITTVSQALALGPTPPMPVQCLLQQCVAYATSGTYARELPRVRAGVPAWEAMLGPLYAPFRLTGLALMHQIAGELEAQTVEAEQLAVLTADGTHGALWQGYAAANLGLAAYERNDLSAAAAHFTRLLQLKYRASYLSYMSGVIGLAQIAVAQPDLAAAQAYANEAMSFAEEIGGPFLRHQALGCAIAVALAKGDFAAALAAASEIRPDVHLGHSLTLETPRFSQARALIVAGTPSHWQQADAILTACWQEVQPLHNLRLQIAVLVLQAQLRLAQSDPRAGCALLDQAVNLAAPRGFQRVFLALGPSLAALLAAQPSLSSQHYLRPLLTRSPAPSRPCALDLLTPREHEILSLLAQRWSDKEIAERLVIAPNTVRKHTGTIYQKLGVNSRREAVAAARARGILADAPVLALDA